MSDFSKAMSVCASLVITMLVGLLHGIEIGERSVQKKATDLGYAHHNPTNGVWEWKK